MATLADLAELVRAPAALSVPGDTIAGAAAAGVAGPVTGGLAAASTCLYWAGMAANDWADRHRDATERPGRPIPSGRVRPGAALAVAGGLTAAGLLLAGTSGGRRALATAAGLATAVWTYDLVAKETAAGPAVMAACRGLDVLLGASPRGAGGLRRAMPAATVVAAHTYAVTVLSRDEVTGTDPAVPATTLAATGAIAGAALAIGGARTARPVARLLGAGLAPALAGAYLRRFGGAQARAVRAPEAGPVRAAVSAGITSFPLLQAALTVRAGRPLTALAVAAAAPAGRRLARLVSPT
ncbi:SCO3242 family prenyltransferase [Actinoplanes utahensis]|uniref:SCO3242 family prenyltransferase n=1 Tax=Actinoplanes utahensis TaxID=1869 RepID=UPI0031E901C7